jgi:hypothetical protein
MSGEVKWTLKERVTAALRDAAFAGESWLSLSELRKAAGVEPQRYKQLGTRLDDWEQRGDIRVDRSRGQKRRRFALITPEELELRLTQFVVGAKHGVDALADRLSTPPSSGGK